MEILVFDVEGTLYKNESIHFTFLTASARRNLRGVNYLQALDQILLDESECSWLAMEDVRVGLCMCGVGG